MLRWSDERIGFGQRGGKACHSEAEKEAGRTFLLWLPSISSPDRLVSVPVGIKDSRNTVMFPDIPSVHGVYAVRAPASLTCISGDYRCSSPTSATWSPNTHLAHPPVLHHGPLITCFLLALLPS